MGDWGSRELLDVRDAEGRRGEDAVGDVDMIDVDSSEGDVTFLIKVGGVVVYTVEENGSVGISFEEDWEGCCKLIEEEDDSLVNNIDVEDSEL
jgi:hypothetical protein